MLHFRSYYKEFIYVFHRNQLSGSRDILSIGLNKVVTRKTQKKKGASQRLLAYLLAT